MSRPLGPGHDSGGKQNGRLREEVDRAYKVRPAVSPAYADLTF